LHFGPWCVGWSRVVDSWFHGIRTAPESRGV
jgi:hypothetical protein